jgi:hypothetical protein
MLEYIFLGFFVWFVCGVVSEFDKPHWRDHLHR